MKETRYTNYTKYTRYTNYIKYSLLIFAAQQCLTVPHFNNAQSLLIFNNFLFLHCHH